MPLSLEEIETTVRARHALVEDLIRAGAPHLPEVLAEAALPADARAALLAVSPDLAAFLEERDVVVEGTFVARAILPLPDAAGAGETTTYELRTAEGVLDLRLAESALASGIATGAEVRLTTTRFPRAGGASAFVVAAAGDVAVLAAAPAAAPAVVGRALFMLINFLDNPSVTPTREQMVGVTETDARSVKNYFLETSFGQQSLAPALTGWHTIGSNADGRCDTNTWALAALEAARSAGLDPSDYDHHLYVFPAKGRGVQTSCNWSGIATIGGHPSDAWINVFEDAGLDFLRRAVAHELGHGLGLDHAGLVACGAAAIDAYGNCTYDEYGDPFDNMGGAYFQLNAPHKLAKRWLPDAVAVTSDGVYDVAPLEPPGTEPQALRIPKPDTGEDYYVSYRVPFGAFDTSFKVPGHGNNAGASLHVWNGAAAGKTKMLVAVPDASFTLCDDASFVDARNGITVTQLAHTADALTVAVRFGPPEPTPTSGRPCGPTARPTPTPQPTPTGAAPGPPVGTADAVVLPLKPLRLVLEPSVAALARVLKVKVRNAGGDGVIALAALDGSCPAGTVAGLPDFDPRAAGPQDSTFFPAGRTKAALVPLAIDAAAFTNDNRRSPRRCALALAARLVPADGGPDSSLANNDARVELNVVAGESVGRAPGHESLIASAGPLALRIARGARTASKLVRMKVTNGDLLPVPESPGHAITVTGSDGDCPAGTLGTIDADVRRAGAQSTVTVGGGKSATATVRVTVDADAFSSRPEAPARCTAAVQVSGPPGNVEPDPTNNTALLIIDVSDANDP